MKTKSLSFFALVAIILTFGSCKKTDGQASVSNSTGVSQNKKERISLNANSYSEENPEYKERNALKLGTNSSNLVDFDSVKNFFTLDFTPEYPDSLFNEKKNSAAKNKNDKAQANKEETSQSYIPGIRKLTDYVTKYVTKKSGLQDNKVNDEAEEDDSTKDFYIEDWGPQGKIVAGENHPSFYVIFSNPARSLQALDKPQTTSDIMTIEPALPGVFHWYGTKHLSFESDVPADPTMQYKISINKELKSAGGKKLTGQTDFQTQAEAVEVINLWGL